MFEPKENKSKQISNHVIFYMRTSYNMNMIMCGHRKKKN